MTSLWTTQPRGRLHQLTLDVLIAASPAMLAPQAVAIWGAQIVIAVHHVASAALFANKPARVNLWMMTVSKIPHLVPNGHILLGIDDTMDHLAAWVAKLARSAADWCAPDLMALEDHPLAAVDPSYQGGLSCCLGGTAPSSGAYPATDLPSLLLVALDARMPPRTNPCSDLAVDYATFFLFLDAKVFQAGVRFRPRPGLCPWDADPNFGRTFLAPLLAVAWALENLSPTAAAENKFVALGLAWHAFASKRAAPAVLFASIRAWHANAARHKHRTVSWWFPTYQDLVPAVGPGTTCDQLRARYPGQVVHIMRAVRTVCTSGNHRPPLPLWPGISLVEIARNISAHLRVHHGGPPPPDPDPTTLARIAGNLARFAPTSATIRAALRGYARETSRTWCDLPPDELCWLAFRLHDHLHYFAPRDTIPIRNLFANLGPRDWEPGVPYAHFGSCLLDDWRVLQTSFRARFEAIRLESIFVVTGDEHRSPAATVTQCCECAAFHEIAVDHECPSLVEAARAWTSPEGLVFWPTPSANYTVDWDDANYQDAVFCDWDLVLATACRLEPSLRSTPTLAVLRGSIFDPKFAFNSSRKVLVAAMQALWQTHVACQRALADPGTLPMPILIVPDSSNRPRILSLRPPERLYDAAAAACRAFASWIVPLASRLARDAEDAPLPILTTGKLLVDTFYTRSFVCGLCCDTVQAQAFFGPVCGDEACNAVCDACCRKLFGRFSDLRARVVGAFDAACPWCRRPVPDVRVRAMVVRKVITQQRHMVAALRHFAGAPDDDWTCAMCPCCETIAHFSHKSCGPTRAFGDLCPGFLCHSCTEAGYILCPTCDAPYQHKGSCLHLHCTLCDTHFCSACRKRFPPPETGPDPLFCIHAHILRTHQSGADIDPLLQDQEWHHG